MILQRAVFKKIGAQGLWNYPVYIYIYKICKKKYGFSRQVTSRLYCCHHQSFGGSGCMYHIITCTMSNFGDIERFSHRCFRWTTSVIQSNAFQNSNIKDEIQKRHTKTKQVCMKTKTWYYLIPSNHKYFYKPCPGSFWAFQAHSSTSSETLVLRLLPLANLDPTYGEAGLIQLDPRRTEEISRKPRENHRENLMDGDP